MFLLVYLYFVSNKKIIINFIKNSLKKKIDEFLQFKSY